jgi:hypothetical protein
MQASGFRGEHLPLGGAHLQPGCPRRENLRVSSESTPPSGSSAIFSEHCRPGREHERASPDSLPPSRTQYLRVSLLAIARTRRRLPRGLPLSETSVLAGVSESIIAIQVERPCERRQAARASLEAILLSGSSATSEVILASRSRHTHVRGGRRRGDGEHTWTRHGGPTAAIPT